jgi:hypothetical protein
MLPSSPVPGGGTGRRSAVLVLAQEARAMEASARTKNFIRLSLVFSGEGAREISPKQLILSPE